LVVAEDTGVGDVVPSSADFEAGAGVGEEFGEADTDARGEVEGGATGGDVVGREEEADAGVGEDGPVMIVEEVVSEGEDRVDGEGVVGPFLREGPEGELDTDLEVWSKEGREGDSSVVVGVVAEV